MRATLASARETDGVRPSVARRRRGRYRSL